MPKLAPQNKGRHIISSSEGIIIIIIVLDKMNGENPTVRHFFYVRVETDKNR